VRLVGEKKKGAERVETANVSIRLSVSWANKLAKPKDGVGGLGGPSKGRAKVHASDTMEICFFEWGDSFGFAEGVHFLTYLTCFGSTNLLRASLI